MIEIKITGGITWNYDPDIRIAGCINEGEIKTALQKLDEARKHLVALLESSRKVSAAEDKPETVAIEHNGISHPVSMEDTYKWVTTGMEER